jgi:hypothetical protein
MPALKAALLLARPLKAHCPIHLPDHKQKQSPVDCLPQLGDLTSLPTPRNLRSSQSTKNMQNASSLTPTPETLGCGGAYLNERRMISPSNVGNQLFFEESNTCERI